MGDFSGDGHLNSQPPITEVGRVPDQTLDAKIRMNV